MNELITEYEEAVTQLLELQANVEKDSCEFKGYTEKVLTYRRVIRDLKAI